MRFLVVEDHLRMADQLAKGFEQRGYTARVVDNGEEALFEASEIAYTLAVVDLGLPGISGLELIKSLRKQGNSIPIVVLTARDDVETIVQAMEAGADDYLKKPVYFEELMAHIEAVLRRVLVDPRLGNPLLQFADLTLDTRKRVVCQGEHRVDLTRAEYEILEHLWRNAGRVQSKKAIADSYQRDSAATLNANSVEGLVSRIKRKIDPDGRLMPIETVRGRGYLFREDVESAESGV